MLRPLSRNSQQDQTNINMEYEQCRVVNEITFNQLRNINIMLNNNNNR